jgi:tetratricopeptide (TPR) repeat protein
MVRQSDRILAVQAGCHQNMGFSLMNLGRNQEAIEELKKALAIFRRLPETKDKQLQCELNIVYCEEFLRTPSQKGK